MSFQIEGPGDYLTREGRKATIVSESDLGDGDIYWLGRIERVTYSEGGYHAWHQQAEGRMFRNWETDNDIVAAVPVVIPINTQGRYFAEL